MLWEKKNLSNGNQFERHNQMQLNYSSVPRNLYNELKMCIDDLLNEK